MTKMLVAQTSASPGSGKREKMPGSGMSPCAACKLLRRRCAKECVFAPYFPADEPQKFANVHKVFGASNVNKMLQELPLHQRSDAVGSMVYEADSRVRDPVYGCVGLISALQQQVSSLQQQLAAAQAQIVSMRMRQAAVVSNVVSLKGMSGMGGGMGTVGSSGASSTMGSSHRSPHHQSHRSPHQQANQSQNCHHSQPQSPEVHNQYKSSGMMMAMDSMDMGQAMWAS